MQAALGEDPGGDQAQALLTRWQGLIDEFTGGDTQVEQGLGKVWADQPNWPAAMQEQAAPFMDRRVWDFIATARVARK